MPGGLLAHSLGGCLMAAYVPGLNHEKPRLPPVFQTGESHVGQPPWGHLQGRLGLLVLCLCICFCLEGCLFF